jgi:hypothetical protein
MDIVFSVIKQNESSLMVVILESLKNTGSVAYFNDSLIKVEDWLFERRSQVYLSISLSQTQYISTRG